MNLATLASALAAAGTTLSDAGALPALVVPDQLSGRAAPSLRKGFPMVTAHDRCAYLIDDAAGRHDCGAVRRPCSPYCAHHHGICYVPIGSRRETQTLRRFEILAVRAGRGRARLGAA
jgi:hypothetical protein